MLEGIQKVLRSKALLNSQGREKLKFKWNSLNFPLSKGRTQQIIKPNKKVKSHKITK